MVLCGKTVFLKQRNFIFLKKILFKVQVNQSFRIETIQIISKIY